MRLNRGDSLPILSLLCVFSKLGLWTFLKIGAGTGSSGFSFIFENTSYSFHFSTFVLNLLRFGSFAANCRLGCKEVLNRQQNAAFLKGAHQPYSSLIILRHLQSILRQEYCFILKKCKNFEKSRNSIRIFTQKSRNSNKNVAKWRTPWKSRISKKSAKVWQRNWDLSWQISLGRVGIWNLINCEQNPSSPSGSRITHTFLHQLCSLWKFCIRPLEEKIHIF